MNSERAYGAYSRELLQHATMARFGYKQIEPIDSNLLQWINPPQTESTNSYPIVSQMIVGPSLYYQNDGKTLVMPLVAPEGRQLYIGKLVLPEVSGMNYQTRKERQEAARLALRLGRRNNLQPDLYEGVYCVLPPNEEDETRNGMDVVINLSRKIEDDEVLDDDHELLLLMREFPFGNTLATMTKNKAAIFARDLAPLMIADLHKNRADRLEGDKAKYFGSFETFREKFMFNDRIFLRGIAEMQFHPQYKERVNAIWTKKSQLIHDRLVKSVFHSRKNTKVFDEIFNTFIRLGLVVDSHGDMKADNMGLLNWGSGRESELYHYVASIDAIDFNDLYRIGICLSDLAHFTSDMEVLMEPGREYYIQEIEKAYFGAMPDIPSGSATDLLYRLLVWDKNQVRAGVKTVWQKDYEGGLAFIENTVRSMRRLNQEMLYNPLLMG